MDNIIPHTKKTTGCVGSIKKPLIGCQQNLVYHKVTSPLYFLLFNNDLPDNLCTNIRLFADDCIMYNRVDGPYDATKLQKDLDTLTEWQNKWQMEFTCQQMLRTTHD